MTTIRIAPINIPDIAIDAGDNRICIHDIKNTICFFASGQLFTLSVIDLPDEQVILIERKRDEIFRHHVKKNEHSTD